MPIRVSCACGKTLAVKDELAGKAIRCPACQQPVRVPAAGGPSRPAAGAKPAAAAKPASGAKPAGGAKPTAGAKPAGGAKPAASGRPPAGVKAAGGAKPAAAQRAAPKPAALAGGLDDLFDEEGMGHRSGPTCPQCLTELKPGAVLCTQCGYHLQTGQRLQAHQTEAERTVLGHRSLDKAVVDLQQERDMQQKLLGTGMPWWLLALVLFAVGSAGVLGVMSVNFMTAEEGASGEAPNVPYMFFMLMSGAMGVTAAGAALIVLFRAFKESLGQGLLVAFVPLYLLYYVATRWSRTGRPFLVYFFAALLAGGALAGAMATQ